MKWLRALAVSLLRLSLAWTLGATEPQGSTELKRELKPTRVYFMASQALFGTYKRDDATATMGIWIKQLCEIEGLRCEIRVDVAYSLAEIRKRLRERTVDVLLLDTPEYLLLAHEGLVEVVAGGTNRGRLAAYPYLLLAKDGKDGTEAAQIAALRGKTIGVASRTGSNLGLIWLETLLAENKLERAVSFFGPVDIGNRPSSCVLPLFFGKIDACVVDSGNWDTITELNPQVRHLKILARSEPLLEGLIAMTVEPQHPYKREIIQAILNMHRTVAGNQLDLIFRAGPQVPVTIKDFQSVANLLNRYRGLLKLPVDPLKPSVGRLNDVREIR